MRSRAFWESPERFAVLGRIEYIDRVEAALRTAEKLSARLARPNRTGCGSAGPRPAVGTEALPPRLCLYPRGCERTSRFIPGDQRADSRSFGWRFPRAAPRHVRGVGAAPWYARAAPAIGVESHARDLGDRRPPDPLGRDRPACLRDTAGRALIRKDRDPRRRSAPYLSAAPDTDLSVLARRALDALPARPPSCVATAWSRHRSFETPCATGARAAWIACWQANSTSWPAAEATVEGRKPSSDGVPDLETRLPTSHLVGPPNVDFARDHSTGLRAARL